MYAIMWVLGALAAYAAIAYYRKRLTMLKEHHEKEMETQRKKKEEDEMKIRRLETRIRMMKLSDMLERETKRPRTLLRKVPWGATMQRLETAPEMMWYHNVTPGKRVVIFNGNTNICYYPEHAIECIIYDQRCWSTVQRIKTIEAVVPI